MNLIDFLQQLTDQGMGITGKHPQCAIDYHLQYDEDGNRMYLTWRADDEKSVEAPDNYAYLDLYQMKIGTVEELHRAAIDKMDAVMYEQDCRLYGEDMSYGYSLMSVPH